MKHLITSLVIVTLVFSCSSSKHIEKRRYRKGFFIQWNNKLKETPQTQINSFPNKGESINNHKLDNLIYSKTSENKITSTSEKTRVTDNQNISFHKKTNSIPKDSQELNNIKVKLTKKQKKTNSIVKQLSDSWIYIFTAIITVLTSWVFVFRKEKSKNISKWASRNPKKAIGTIVSIKIALAFGALHFGAWLFGEGLNFSSSTLTTFFTLFVISSAMYPHRKNRKGLFKQGYIRQKLHDISIVSLGGMMLMSLGNLSSQDANFSPPLDSFITNTSFYDFDTIQATSFTEENKNDGGNIVWKIFLSILVIIIFVSLLYIVAILTCLLACNGHEILAIGLFIFGLSGSIILLAIASKAIWSSQSKKKEDLDPEF